MRRGSDAVDCFAQSSGVDIDLAGSVVAAVVVMGGGGGGCGATAVFVVSVRGWRA